MEFAGEAWEDKISRVRENLLENKLFGMVVTELDEIAWLFNIRGEGEEYCEENVRLDQNIPGSSHNEGLYHTPTFESMALVTPQEIILWVHPDKVRGREKLCVIKSVQC